MTEISQTVGGLEQVDDRISLTTPTSRDRVFGDFDSSSIPLEKEEWPVVIMGSSLVGMMTGLLLGYHGIKSVSFDRRPTILSHPRATGINFRTAEILRQIGLESRCREESVREFDIDSGMLVVEQMVGGRPGRTVQDHDPKLDQEMSPSQWLWLTQSMLEPILTEYAPKFGYSMELGKDIVHYEEQADGVIVVVKDLATNDLKKYKAKYMVACDGNRSATRRKEGIDVKGQGVLSNSLNIRFKADLRTLLGDRARHGIIYITTPHIQGAFRQEDRGKSGLLWVNSVDGRTEFPPGSVTEEDAMKYLYECSGLTEGAGLELQSFAHWTVASVTAERFSSKGGRVFIAGDAAHIMPPNGALGGNTGCGDAHNLAWKLAYVLTGRADPSLLTSYQQERQPVDAFVVDQATRRYWNRIFNKIPRDPEEPYYTVEIGHRYNKGAIVSDQDEIQHENFENPHAPSGTAGTRFPHVPLEREDGAIISTLDLVKHNFVLVAAEADSPWILASQALKLTVDAYELHESSQPYRDSVAKLREKAKLRVGSALLVRPDGFIAWRGKRISHGHEEQLRRGLGQVLGKLPQ